MMNKCPGSQAFSQPHPEDIKCPHCGAEVEIFSDEIKVTCPGCNKTVVREEGATCLDWCRYAKECVGDKLFSKFMRNKMVTLKDKLIKDLEEHFGLDRRRIEHAKKVMSFAEELLKEAGGDWHIVIPASILHDVGIKEAERKHASSSGKYQEAEGPPIARKILMKEGFRKEYIDEICEIIAHHHTPGKVLSQNFKVLYDADRLVNMKDEQDIKDKAKIKAVIDKVFLTGAGKALAEKTYL